VPENPFAVSADELRAFINDTTVIEQHEDAGWQTVIAEARVALADCTFSIGLNLREISHSGRLEDALTAGLAQVGGDSFNQLRRQPRFQAVFTGLTRRLNIRKRLIAHPDFPEAIRRLKENGGRYRPDVVPPKLTKLIRSLLTLSARGGGHRRSFFEEYVMRVLSDEAGIPVSFLKGERGKTKPESKYVRPRNAHEDSPITAEGDEALPADVHAPIQNTELAAVLADPVLPKPYKISAAEWGSLLERMRSDLKRFFLSLPKPPDRLDTTQTCDPIKRFAQRADNVDELGYLTTQEGTRARAWVLSHIQFRIMLASRPDVAELLGELNKQAGWLNLTEASHPDHPLRGLVDVMEQHGRALRNRGTIIGQEIHTIAARYLSRACGMPVTIVDGRVEEEKSLSPQEWVTIVRELLSLNRITIGKTSHETRAGFSAHLAQRLDELSLHTEPMSLEQFSDELLKGSEANLVGRSGHMAKRHLDAGLDVAASIRHFLVQTETMRSRLGQIRDALSGTSGPMHISALVNGDPVLEKAAKTLLAQWRGALRASRTDTSTRPHFWQLVRQAVCEEYQLAPELFDIPQAYADERAADPGRTTRLTPDERVDDRFERYPEDVFHPVVEAEQADTPAAREVIARQATESRTKRVTFEGLLSRFNLFGATVTILKPSDPRYEAVKARVSQPNDPYNVALCTPALMVDPRLPHGPLIPVAIPICFLEPLNGNGNETPADLMARILSQSADITITPKELAAMRLHLSQQYNSKQATQAREAHHRSGPARKGAAEAAELHVGTE